MEECLQYGAWLRGEPNRRYPKEPVNHGGGENQEYRGGVTRVKLEKTQNPFDVPGEKPVGGSDHVTELFSQGGSSLTWEEANLDVPKLLTKMLHGNGKVDGRKEREKKSLPL